MPVVHVREHPAESLTIVTEGNFAIAEAPSVHAILVASGEPAPECTGLTGVGVNDG